MAEFKMPSLGADMEAGTLIEWLVKPGSRVKRGDIIAVVDTEKAAIDVEIWIDGVVEKLLVEPGIRVPVGTVLAIIRVEGEAPQPERPMEVPAPPPKLAPPAPAAAPTAPSPVLPGRGPAEAHRATPWARRLAQELGVDLGRLAGTGPAGVITHSDVKGAAAAREEPAATQPVSRQRISPLARRRAQELGVHLARVQGTGADGAITVGDVEKLAAAPKPRPAVMGPKERAAAMRRAIAQAMTRSKREIPHYYLGLEIPLDRALTWLEQENGRRPITERLLYSVLLIKAVALSVRDVPEMNGFWVNDAFQQSQAVHVGMAISLRGGGLVAPALHSPDQKPLTVIMAELRDLVARTRSGSLRSSEMTDPTITISNLGEQGVDDVFGIIFPPQVALVGFGRISTRRTVRASLSGDHRASDGHRGGVFLASIDRRLQSPESL